MSDDAVRWLVGSLASAIVVLVGAVVTLLVASFRIGRAYGALDAATKKLEEALHELRVMRDRMGRIDVFERTVAQLENAVSRTVSDIRDLLTRVSRIEGRQQSGSWEDER